MKSIFAKWNRPINRSWFAAPTFFLFFFLIELFELNSHNAHRASGGRHYDAPGLYIFSLIMTLIFAAQWLFSISGRMVALKLNRIWIVAYLVPWVMILAAMVGGNAHQVAAAVVFAFAVQFPLMLLPARSEPPKIDLENNAGAGP